MREHHIISFYLEPSLSFMMVPLFVSVSVFMLVQDINARDVTLTLCCWLGDLTGSQEGEILPEMAE